jgi:leader peptidase (prepilin peptidase)/N-methyltransferase
MIHAPLLEIVAGIAGLVAASALVFAAPRLVAYRLDESPSLPSAALLVPLAGGWLAGWRPLRTLGFEVALAGIWVALSVHFGAHRQLLIAAAFAALLMLISLIDLEHRLVLNRLSYPGFVLSLALAALWPGVGILSAALGAAVGLAIFLALQVIGRGRMGSGDTKLAAVIGAMTGFPGVLHALFLGIVLGGLGAVIYLVALRQGRRSYMPYGPYLAAGAIIAFFLV